MTHAGTRDQDVRFDSALSWVWWPLICDDRSGRSLDVAERAFAECIDGTSGFVCDYIAESSQEGIAQGGISLVSTCALVHLFSLVSGQECTEPVLTLQGLRAFKREVSTDYETAQGRATFNAQGVSAVEEAPHLKYEPILHTHGIYLI